MVELNPTSIPSSPLEARLDSVTHFQGPEQRKEKVDFYGEA